MKECQSPYVVEVYNFDNSKKEYTMEKMDDTLDKYIQENNTKLTFKERKHIGLQVLKGFSYIHSKNILHRDISPKNVLVKYFDDVNVFKISDFGLVKIPDSKLTAFDTKVKGYFNDPALETDNFKNYNILHEMYALTRLLAFVLTGKTNCNHFKNKSIESFVNRGLHSNKKERYQNIKELRTAFLNVRE